jgi:four helix bundle protein
VNFRKKKPTGSPSNLGGPLFRSAEGKGRSSDKELLHFLSNAKGSLFEVETQIMIADRLGYLPHSQGEYTLSQTAEVGRLLNGLIKAFRTIPAA